MKNVKDVEELEEIIASDKDDVVVVKVSAVWCGPCKVLSGTIAELEKEKLPGVVFVEVNADECDDICDKYNVRNLPTLIFLRGGVVMERVAGLVTKADLFAKIDSVRHA